MVELPAEPLIALGRAPECGLVLDDDSVSRKHAILHLGERLEIEDCGSRNGTVVGGRTLAPGERFALDAGSVVEIGAATVVVQTTRPKIPSSAAPPCLREEIVVLDPTMKRIYGMLDLIAPSPLNVMVFGETGTGKELFAAEIHRRSTRAGGPMVAVNCANLSGSLLESELFGHERGAFTGATNAREGLFEAADGGTLFLDEIGELPLDTQGKLLRAVDRGEVVRLGSTVPRQVDVRIVAATHRELRKLTREGAFRSDLLFRLNGFNVTLPALRRRPDEILPLAERFLASAAKDAGARVPRITDDASRALRAYTWPGNIRELRNVVQRAFALSRNDETIDATHLIFDDIDPPPSRASATAPPMVLSAQVDDFERQRVVEALTSTHGNQTEAARILGISRRTLINKIEALGIGRPRKRR